MITKETAMIEVNPTKPEVQLILLRSHLRLYAVGMRHSRMTGKDLLARVSLILGQDLPAWAVQPGDPGYQQLPDAAERGGRIKALDNSLNSR